VTIVACTPNALVPDIVSPSKQAFPVHYL